MPILTTCQTDIPMENKRLGENNCYDSSVTTIYDGGTKRGSKVKIKYVGLERYNKTRMKYRSTVIEPLNSNLLDFHLTLL